MSEDANKLKAKLRKKSRDRNAVKDQMKELEAKDKTLANEIKVLLEEAIEAGVIAEDDRSFAPSKTEGGYRLDKPEQVIYHQPAWRERLEAVAPKVRKMVFRKTETFDKKALEEAIERGDVPDADELLEDPTFTEIKPMTPRLMPTKAAEDPDAKKGKAKK